MMVALGMSSGGVSGAGAGDECEQWGGRDGASGKEYLVLPHVALSALSCPHVPPVLALRPL